ncbi:MAG: glycosyltransferase, partial [Dermatophilaceae bacterium]
MIRILHYGLSSNLGGIETYLWNLARTVDRGTYRFDFLYSDIGRVPALSRELAAQGCSFHGVTARRVSPRRNRQELAELITPERLDILHFHANTASYVEPVRAALRSGVNVIVHSHNAGTSRSPVTQILHRVNRTTMPWSRIKKVAVSQAAGRWMFGRGDGFEVIPNGIDVDAFRFDPRAREQVRASLGLGSEHFVVGQVGGFLPAKNQGFSLDVFVEVLRVRPDSVLLFVGTGPLEERARSRARELSIDDRVHFLGRRDDIPPLMSAMDALLFPSRYEGFGLVALEDQAAGLPCCVSEAIPPAVLVLPTA